MTPSLEKYILTDFKPHVQLEFKFKNNSILHGADARPSKQQQAKAKTDFDKRYKEVDWNKYHNSLPFNNSALALYEWSPIAEELKTLDRKIVLNSMILKWDNIKKEFNELINF